VRRGNAPARSGPSSELRDEHWLKVLILKRVLSQELDELDEELFASGVVCQAFDENNFQIGSLLIDGDGKILGVNVKPECRRKALQPGCCERSARPVTPSPTIGRT
jgi:hypothetical protein